VEEERESWKGKPRKKIGSTQRHIFPGVADAGIPYGRGPGKSITVTNTRTTEFLAISCRGGSGKQDGIQMKCEGKRRKKRAPGSGATLTL